MSKCSCENGGHALLCPVHAEEAMELMGRLPVAPVSDDQHAGANNEGDGR